jgi:hypothetical protein
MGCFVITKQYKYFTEICSDIPVLMPEYFENHPLIITKCKNNAKICGMHKISDCKHLIEEELN